mmetsp:Transcript_42712/g.65584  ORF Transcript_42712/g.65584 Transcript_42712/m.65584 type:complete len:113 (-) Transcript_42712:85-423(-)
MPLAGDLFPRKYPLVKPKLYEESTSYFYRKYYISQRMFLSFTKNPMYCNYEVLVNVFNQQIIDMSRAKIIHLNTSSMGQEAFEKFIKSQHRFSEFQQDLMRDKIQALQDLER